MPPRRSARRGKLRYRIETRIILIDGTALARLMIAHGAGVTPVAVYELKRVDLDFFAENSQARKLSRQMRQGHSAMEIVEIVAVLACALFAGASVYINLVEHPARMSCGTALAVTQWAPSYKRATVMQVSLALLATITGVIRGAVGGGIVWYVAAAFIFAVIPFTIIVVLPTNHRLLAPGRDLASTETQQLLEKWGRLHGVRSALSVVASLLFVWAR